MSLQGQALPFTTAKSSCFGNARHILHDTMKDQSYTIRLPHKGILPCGTCISNFSANATFALRIYLQNTICNILLLSPEQMQQLDSASSEQ